MKKTIIFLPIISFLVSTILTFNSVDASKLSSYSDTISHKSNSVAAYITQIETHLNTYQREDAYQEALKAYQAFTEKTPPIEKLEVLTYLVELEYYYWIEDAFSQHTIELYTLAIDKNNDQYLLVAINYLSRMKHLNYDNESSYELLQSMLTFEYEDMNNSTLINYHLGMSMLYSDLSEFEKAFNSLDKAFTLINENKSLNVIGQPIAFLLFDYQAYYYFLQGDYIQAIDTLITSLDLIDSDDIETMFIAKYMLAKYYIYQGDYEPANAIYGDLVNLYAKTGPLFKNKFPKEDMLSLEANIAYLSENYKYAAYLYQKLYRHGPEMEEIERAVTARENLVNFHDSLLEDKLTLYEQLEASQRENIKIRTKTIIIISIFGLFIIAALIIIVLQKRRLHLLSTTDHLTKLDNRHKIMETFDKIKPGQYFIALLDLDHFKEVNDTYGHLFGDLVLEKVAQTIKKSLGSKDCLGRYGGEEFILMLYSQDVNHAKDMIEGLLNSIINLEWDYPNLHITASIGLVYSTTIVGNQLLDAAYEQMYLSKSKGRNQYNFKILT